MTMQSMSSPVMMQLCIFYIHVHNLDRLQGLSYVCVKYI